MVYKIIFHVSIEYYITQLITMHDVYPLLEKTNFPRIFREKLHTIQINLGYKCNQSCSHCHVDAGPYRSEMMNDANISLIPYIINKFNIHTVSALLGSAKIC